MLANRILPVVLLLPCLLHAFTATRSIHFNPKKPSQCRVRIDFEGEFPRAFLLVETLASDAGVQDAVWNGRPFPANREFTPEEPPRPTGHWRWLFGYGEGNPPCESGRLEYTLVFPASYSFKARATIEGKLLTSENECLFVAGETSLYETVGIRTVVGCEGTLTLAHGWNLVAVPCPLSDEWLSAASVEAWYGLDAAAGAYLQLAPAEVGEGGRQPVWAYRAADSPLALPLSWGEACGMSDGRRAMPRGWMLRTASETIVEGRRERWHWQGSHYRPGEAQGTAAFWERTEEDK